MLHTRESGPKDAPTILFLHGGGLSGRQWTPQMQQLSDYHCLVPDLPEQGQSRATAPLTLDGAAEDVLNILSVRARDGRAHVVGSSFGGTLALHLLRVAPEYIETAVMSGGSAGLGRFLGGISLASVGMYRLLPIKTLIQLSRRQFGVPAEFWPMVQEDLELSANAGFSRNLTTAMMQLRLPTDCQMPVLAVVGEHETWYAKQAARQIATALPNARAALAPGVGHIWNLEAPELFTAMLRAWIVGECMSSTLRPL